MEDEETTRQYWQAFIAESEQVTQELFEKLIAMQDEIEALFSALLFESGKNIIGVNHPNDCS